uniref:Uncharacterized protein n=1 Tax=Arundo donax TaxID=35708 RepID=A0A0A9BDA5_ARUDO
METRMQDPKVTICRSSQVEGA